ncbi:hypothetical protein GCM10027280_14180 [Micromonospora polyrhachis]|uniref:DNA-binding PadR family transcriptional regulator n=1 Tax=Micromonospora polyrhachis TaxID=1282883 RepID=A0A7W7WRC0_9ACTN|nr:PadR family transcriptional regulator [Micromonospora polyrhachis]MBB4960153.1 DNA-binding PadR family transcriptional regulator [Micromonospora polyrhachis]
MTAVFSHGRLRLYLLKLLDAGPKHGYELIRRLEERFLGYYAPSAGTIYPRLQRMEVEGRVTHTAAGGRKVYEITDAGRAELRQRAREVADLESDIRSVVAELAGLTGETQTEVPEPTREYPGQSSVRERPDELSVRERPGESRGAARRSRPSQPIQPTRLTRLTPRAAPGATPTGTEELDHRLAAFVVEVRSLVGERQLTEAQLGTAIRMLDGTIDGLRRLLR